MISTEVNVGREMYGRNGYWCNGVKGLKQIQY